MPNNPSERQSRRNLREYRADEQKYAQAAVRFIEAIERGTAIIPLPQPGGEIQMRGGVAFYRALAGDLYHAKVISIDMDGAVIDVIVPGVEERLRLTRIPIR